MSTWKKYFRHYFYQTWSACKNSKYWWTSWKCGSYHQRLKKCRVYISSDLKEYIQRTQIWVLPNFSMTDYTSEGKTVGILRAVGRKGRDSCLSHYHETSGLAQMRDTTPQPQDPIAGLVYCRKCIYRGIFQLRWRSIECEGPWVCNKDNPDSAHISPLLYLFLYNCLDVLRMARATTATSWDLFLMNISRNKRQVIKLVYNQHQGPRCIYGRGFVVFSDWLNVEP